MTADTVAAVQEGFVNIGSMDRPADVHYYRCGEGPAVLLLHPSPMAASVFVPLLKKLGCTVTAIAIDTPGYGLSDPLEDTPGDGLAPYVDAIERVRCALALGPIAIFGAATGSQIAAEYAKTYADHCVGLVLDAVADFPAEQYSTMLDGYFPDLTPHSSGSHLARVWSMALDQQRFFPWQQKLRSAWIGARPIDAEAVQVVATQILQAGANYDRAYRAAFANERAEKLLSITVPVVIMRPAASVVKTYTDRFDNYDWPSNVKMHHCGATPDERQAAAVAVIAELTATQPVAEPKHAPSASGRRFFDGAAGPLFSVEYAGHGERDWLLLHATASSVNAVHELSNALADTGAVYAVDLPGHGSSPAPAGDDFVAATSTAVAEYIDARGLANLGIVAIGDALAVAAALAAQDSGRLREIVLLNPTQAREPLTLDARRDGAHLITLWHELINDELYWPRDEWQPGNALDGEPQLEAAVLTQALIDAHRSRATANAARTACAHFDANARFAELALPITAIRLIDTTAGHQSIKSFAAGAPIVDHHASGAPPNWLPEILQRN